MQTKQGAEATEIFKSELQHDLQTDSFHTLNQSPISAKLKSREVETRKVPELFPNIQLMSLYEQGLQVGECRCRKKREVSQSEATSHGLRKSEFGSHNLASISNSLST